jgi:hypothetical protein
MVTLSHSADGVLVIQRETPPFVYLDHWALMDFASSEALSDRLVAAVHRRKGTFAVSWVNLAEFMTLLGIKQAEEAEGFIDRLLANVFFMEIDPFIVVRREDRILAGQPQGAPHGDEALIRGFVLRQSPPPAQPTARGLFAELTRGSALPSMATLGQVFVRGVEALRAQLAKDPGRAKLWDQPPKDPRLPRATRLILDEIIRGLAKDRLSKMDLHHCWDFFHTVVPSSYCDLVLLDGYWEEQVERTRPRAVQESWRRSAHRPGVLATTAGRRALPPRAGGRCRAVTRLRGFP